MRRWIVVVSLLSLVGCAVDPSAPSEDSTSARKSKTGKSTSELDEADGDEGAERADNLFEAALQAGETSDSVQSPQPVPWNVGSPQPVPWKPDPEGDKEGDKK